MTLPTREEILGLIEAPHYRPAEPHDLASHLGVEPAELTKFLRLLRQMEREGLLISGKGGRLAAPARMGLLTGKLSVSPRGYGSLTPLKGGPYYVDRSDLNGAIHGDIVLARPLGSGKDGRRAKVLKVIKRGTTSITGVYYSRRGFGEVRPDDPRLDFHVFIAPDHAGLAADEDRVVVEIERYPEPGQDARGRVTQVIGRSGDPEADARAIALRFGFYVQFPEDALEEAAQVPDAVSEYDIAGRRDLRDRLIVTIDGEDAKDFDDAVCLERTAGGWRLGVHIADVSAYVKEGSALDTSAYSRATSVYLHGTVLPMLPFELSNGVCSLNPNVDRLTVSVFMDVDGCGNVLSVDMARSVIRSRFRLTYESVNQYFDGAPAPVDWPAGLAQMLGDMRALSHVLRRRRMERGSLDFDFPEWRVKLDNKNMPLDVYRYRRGDAEKLIEEFMILCNEAVAAHLFHLGLPCMFRVHERPDKKDLDELNLILEPFGYMVKGTNNPHPRAIQAVLDQVKEKPEEAFVSECVLRALKKARYSPVWLGHFGLASPMYCHFTSPIRRYPDLIVHRVLCALLEGRWQGDDWGRVRSSLDEEAEHCSEREIAAKMAELESLEQMKMLYMKNKVGEVFQGVISNVVPFGIFVELDNGVSGLVHVSTLEDGWWDYDDAKGVLRNKRTGSTLRMGQRVFTQVTRVDTGQKRVDLVLVKE